MRLPIEMLRRSCCSLEASSPAYCRRFGRRTWYRVRSGCQIWTSQMCTTAALLSRHRWEHLCMLSHRHQGMRAVLSASTWYCQWGGWTHPFFSVHFRKLTDVANALADTDLLVLSYGAISEIPENGPGPPHTPDSLTNIDCIWMTSSQQCKGSQIANTDFLMAQSVPSSGSSCHYRGSSKTR